MGNTELADLLAGQHSELDIDFKPGDIAAQRQALKKLAEDGDEDEDGDDGWGPDEAPPAAPAPQAARATERPATPAPAADPTAVVDRVFDLARDCGGWENLRRLVDRLADLA